MKKQVLTTVSMMAILGAVAVNTAEVSAANNSSNPTASNLGTTGHVTIGEAKDIPPHEGGGTTDPENPDKDIDIDDKDQDTNDKPGPLKVISATKLNFGEVEMNGQAIKKAAALTKVTTAEGAAEERSPMIVAYGDIRLAPDYGYTLSVGLEKQFTKEGSTEELTNSIISFDNAFVEQKSTNENVYGTVQNGGSYEIAYSATGDNDKPVVVADAAAKEGKGEFVLAFGKSSFVENTDPLYNKAAESVKLNVPQKTVLGISKGNYEGIVTWKLVPTPEV